MTGRPHADGDAVRSPLARSLDRSLVALAVGAAALALLQLLLVPLTGPDGWLPALFPLLFAGYTAAGIVAWHRRPGNGTGALLVVAGATLHLGGWSNSSVPALQAVGTITATAVLAAIVHLLLAFPTGRLRGRASVAIVVAAYATAVVLAAPAYLFDAHGALAIADLPVLARTGAVVQGALGGLVLIAAAVVLAGRLRAASPAHRRVLAPLYGYGIAAVVVLALSGNILGRLGHAPAAVVAVVQLVAVAGIPIAFLLGLLTGGFARTGEVEELATRFGPADRATLTTALATAVGDPTLGIAYWVPGRDAYTDADGAPTTPDAARGVVEVETDGHRVAAITYDPQRVDDPETVRTAGRVVATLLERERLVADLRASRIALQDSRERLVDADDRGRRQLAQDLHDGLQVQLVLLSIEAQQLANALAQESEAPTRLREGIDGAAAELRRLVQSVMPAALVERGLAAACDDLADRMPFPTRVALDLGDAPRPPVVDRTAYFVVAESLTNAVKYAKARSASVRIARVGDTLRVEVHDDGVGGATAGGGAGMRGLAERVDVLGGTMDLTSTPGEGTHIMVELPCGS